MSPLSSASVSLRSPRPEDSFALGRAFFDAFAQIDARHGFPSDLTTVEDSADMIRQIVETPGVEGIVAEQDGVAVGSAFLWTDGRIGAIGPVSVAPQAQDASVGRRMMQWSVERADELDQQGQRLIQATYHSRALALYAKLGFDVKESLAVMHGSLQARSSDRPARPLIDADLNAANALCRRVHGHPRGGELALAVAHGEAIGVFDGERLTGYATAVGSFGHAVAESNDDLLSLVAAGGSADSGIFVPTRNGELFRALLEGGLRIRYPVTLMARGFYQEPVGAYLRSILY